jgi:dipeptidyl-peptidase-4
VFSLLHAGATAVTRKLPFIFLVLSTCISFTQAQRKPLTIEAIFAEGGITGREPENLQWSPDGSRLSFIQRDDAGEHGELWYVDAATGEKKVLVSEAKLATLSPPMEKIQNEREKERLSRYSVAAYRWSPDSKRLLFDSRGQLWMYNLDHGIAFQFTSNPEPSLDPKFSPDGTRVAYVRHHNLYVQTVAGKKEKQLTRDKDENLLNGEVDWVYAEELEVRSNYFWSPDGSQIAFLQMDETQVPTYPITDWIPTHPKVDAEKYPKAGDPNPAVRLGVVGSTGGRVKWISLTEDTDIYLPRFGWIRNGMLWAQVLNRAQDKIDLYFIDVKSGRSRRVLSETDDAWINVTNDFRILKSGDRFLWSSWRDGHTHLYLYSFDSANPLGSDARLERQITNGDFEMLGVEGVDEEAGVVYVTANPGDPRQQKLYGVKLDGSDFHPVLQPAGTEKSSFDSSGRAFISQYAAPLQPSTYSLCKTDGICHLFWEPRSIKEYELSADKDLVFNSDDGTTLYGQLLLPPADSTPPGGKLPLIIYIYGGPAGQTVRNDWIGTTGLFHRLLAQRGFAVFTLDNRGSPHRGRKFSTAIRHQFGAVELKDQITALDQLLAQYPQLDKDRIGIWGWSNGGSMTLYTLTHSDRFKAGVSVAPVTDWHNYDSIYTERYMGSPKDNAKGYEQSSITAAAKQLSGSLLLVHGTSDDNVHMQNSIQMIDALIKSGKKFRMMMYPNKTHSIAGPPARNHLFHMIEDHFERELK